MVTSDQAMNAVLVHMDGDFSWDINCCCRTASKAFQALWGIDPMGEHGYATARQAYAAISSAGGRDAYISGLARKAGLETCSDEPGAIGIVLTGQGLGWALGICIEPKAWAVKADRGVMFHTDYEKAWRAKCRNPSLS